MKPLKHSVSTARIQKQPSAAVRNAAVPGCGCAHRPGAGSVVDASGGGTPPSPAGEDACATADGHPAIRAQAQDATTSGQGNKVFPAALPSLPSVKNPGLATLREVDASAEVRALSENWSQLRPNPYPEKLAALKSAPPLATFRTVCGLTVPYKVPAYFREQVLALAKIQPQFNSAQVQIALAGTKHPLRRGITNAYLRTLAQEGVLECRGGLPKTYRVKEPIA